VFTAPSSVNCVRVEILRTCAEREFELVADVFMPDHIHLLLDGSSDRAEFKPFMTLFRQRSAVAFRKLRGEALWQDGYFERVLREEEHTAGITEYIVGNPVRAGLVATPADYPYLWCKYGLTPKSVTPG
jgi:putative transposase